MKGATGEEIHAALGICATIIGAGFASGREIVTFFSQFGLAGWLGVPAAGACVAWIVYLLLSLAQRTQADSLPVLYGRLLNRSCGRAMHLLYAALCLMSAAAMLSASGELCALTLPLREARALGVVMTLALALWMSGCGLRALCAAGAALLPAMLAFFLLAGRGAVHSRSTVRLQDLALALPMGVLYASFNGALCAGSVVLAARRRVRPLPCALAAGCMMTAVLAAGQGAMLRAGEALRALTLPAVALAARQWGAAGFYVSACCLYLAVLTTLVGMLLSLRAQAAQLLPNQPALCLLLPALGALLLSVCGFEGLVSVAYPLLGWLCLLTLPGLVGSAHFH